MHRYIIFMIHVLMSYIQHLTHVYIHMVCI